MILDLPEPTRVCIFPLDTFEDMPQQRANASFKSIENGRFHNQIMKLRDEMTRLRFTAKKENFATKRSLFVEQSALVQLFSALDIIVIRLSDPAHSEYCDLCKQLLLFLFLLDTIITPTAAVQAYVTAIRHWPLAPGFA